MIDRAKWLGLWVLNTAIATFGVMLTGGLLMAMGGPLVPDATKARIALTPFYVFPVALAFLAGLISRYRFRGSYRFWVWSIPLANLIRVFWEWKDQNGASWGTSLMHFFGYASFPDNKDQLNSTVFLYLAVAYSIGAALQSLIGSRIVRISRSRDSTADAG